MIHQPITIFKKLFYKSQYGKAFEQQRIKQIKVSEELSMFRSKYRSLKNKFKKLKNKYQKLQSKNRDSIFKVMNNARNCGFVPKTVIDVGFNTETEGLYDHSSDIKYIMVDPLIESKFYMASLCRELKDAKYELCCLGAEEKMAQITVPETFGGTVVQENNNPSPEWIKCETRNVKMKTLDQLVSDHNAKGPFVIKIDTEGSELEVLKGAKETLKNTELIIIETRLVPFGNSPQFFEVINFLKEHGHVLYDLIDRNYDLSYQYLKQLDLVTVKEVGFFRDKKSYKNLPIDENNVGKNLEQEKHKSKLIKRNIVKNKILQKNREFEDLYIR